MTGKPAVEMALLIADPRWPAYHDALEARFQATVKALLKPANQHEHVVMARLAGEASALKYALGLPAELQKTDPQTTSNPGDDT